MSDRVTRWLTELSLGEYATAFAENDIDAEVLPELTDADLREMGVSLGHRKKMLKAIAALQANDTASTQADDTLGDEPDPTPVKRADAERRHLTVMFCDLVGSTALSEQLDLEELRDVIGSFQRACTETIERFDGYIARYMGDGLLVYFGFPRAHEDDAERACRAGLSIVEAVCRLPEQGVAKLEVRVGIATGLVLVGDVVGEGAAEERSVLGETPNLAARLQSSAPPDSVVVAESTQLLIEGLFLFEELRDLSVKGISKPVTAYRVKGETTAPSRFEAAAARGLTALVGREEEVGLLWRRWRQACNGEGQVLMLSGDAGVGKSRILRGFQARAAGEIENRVLYFGSSYHLNSAFHPVIDQIERGMRFDGNDSAEQKLDKLDSVLDQLALPVSEHGAALAHLLSLPLDSRYPPLEVEPVAIRRKIIDAVCEMLRAMSARRPVLVVMEDAHWIDPSTKELLGAFIECIPELPVLTVITYRPEFAPPWGEHPHLTSLSLNRLGPSECRRLIENVTEGKALPEFVLSQIIEKTDGVPLFVEELTKTVLNSGVLEDRGEHFGLKGTLQPLTIPDTIHDSLMARLDRLASAKEIAQLAAVIGRTFRLALLSAVSQMTETDLLTRLAELVEAGIIHDRRQWTENIYEFKHALVQEAAYDSLLISTRREFHRRIADVLAGQYRDEGELEYELLALHAFRGEQWSQAADYARQASVNALERSAYDESIAHLKQALAALEHLPRSEALTKSEIDIRFELRTALQAIGDHEQVIEHLRVAETLASTLKEQRRLGWASAYMTQYMWRLGNAAEAEASGKRAIAIAEANGDFPLEAVAAFFLGQGYYNTGNYQRGIDYCRANVTAITGERIFDRLGLTGLPSVLSRIWLAWCLAERGEFEDALSSASEALEIAETSGQGYSMSAACLGMGQTQLLRGSHDQAVEFLERSATLCEKWHLGVIAPTTGVLLELARALGGAGDGYEAVISETESLSSEVRIFDTPTARIAAGAIYLLSGKVKEAESSASRCAELAAERGFRGTQAKALLLLGDVSVGSELPGIDQAQDRYLQALAIAEELSMRPLIAHCHLALGALRTSTDEPRDARRKLTAAAEMYEAMGMDFYLVRARTAIEKLG